LHAISLDFCKALGENKTLEYLNMGVLTPGSTAKNLNSLFNAVAFNKMKNGPLTHLSVMGFLNNTTSIKSGDQFFEFFEVSE